MCPEKTRVLVVDDIAEVREKVRKLLQFEADIEVAGAARSGREAIQLTDELKPDVVLMDINMPDMDGITATEMIRQRNSGTQIIILSVQGDPNYMRRAMLAGARDYLTKPPMADELISAVRRAGEMARQERVGSNYRIKISQHAIAIALEAKQLDLSIFDSIARIQLYKADPLKGKLTDEFESLLTGIAHDLKSPLSIAANILEILATEDKNQIKYIEKLWHKLIFTKWIADNFLGICLSEKTGNSSILLSKLVLNTVNLLSEQIPKEIYVNIQIPPDIKIDSDENLLRLVLINLIMNASENIGNKMGFINIFMSKRDEEISIIISDTGSLISEENKDNLFQIGFTTKSDHLGNGLYVSKRLLNQVKADLNFRSTSPEQPQTFEIVIKQWHQEPVVTDQLVDELKKTLGSLNVHLSTLRSRPLSQPQQNLLQTEFGRQTKIFTNRLTQELMIIESMIFDINAKLKDKDAEFSDALKKVANNCTYCRLLTRNILEIGGGITLKLTAVSLIEVIEEVLSLVDRKMPQDLYSVEFEVDPKVVDIEADPLQLMQVFMNLIRNAIDAMPHGGHLKIFVGQAQEWVLARIYDSGVGIPPENLPKLFKMGFSTKPSGYGIGLYSVKNIIDKHQGIVEVESKVNKGTTFTVWLPIHQKTQ